MDIDLRAMTRRELEKLRQDVDMALERAIERDRKSAMAAAQRAARKHGFDLSELASKQVPIGRKRKKTEKSASPAKYQHPGNPSMTWSGKGRRPKWMKDAEDAGRSRQEFLIQK